MKRLTHITGAIGLLIALFIVTAAPGGGGGGSSTTLAYSGLTASTSGPTVPQATATNGGGSNVTINYPSASQAGDFALGIADTITSCTPSPCTLIDTQTGAGGTATKLFAHKIGLEGFATGGLALVGGVFPVELARISNSPAGTIVQDVEGSNNTADATTSTGPTVTTTVANDTCLCFTEHASGTHAITITGPAGITLVTNAQNSQAIYKFTQTAAGLTTACVGNDSATTTKGWANFVACFKPLGN